jgi:toxin-antitoxin system PIN domain toxin
VKRALLDINVLLALLDSDHIDHRRAHEWLARQLDGGWSSCALTENGFVRIISQPRYPSPISPTRAVALLAEACNDPHHEFWPCTVSVLDPSLIDARKLHGPRQVTDTYLLALAVQHDGRFATFDRSVPLGAVSGATPEHLAIV